MKTIELHFTPGDECYVKGQTRTCYIDQVIISKKNNGEPDITYTWYNLDFGVDVTELWDEGDFSPEDIGKTVFTSIEEYQKACPEDFEVPDYEGDEFSFYA
jgi:hypothetical protein